jgi:hypothetical protein
MWVDGGPLDYHLNIEPKLRILKDEVPQGEF